MTRRALLFLSILAAAAGVTAAAGAADSIPESGRLSFGIFRNGDRIGSRDIRFRRDGDVLTVDSRVEIAVKILFITVYTVSERKVETWRGGALAEFRADIDDNGAKSRLSIRRANGRLLVEGPKGKAKAPSGTLPSTYWNEATVRQSRLIDSSTGEILNIRVSGATRDRIDGPAGGTIAARRYSMTGGLERVLWYDLKGVWAGLKMTARDGSTIEYRRK